LACDGSPRILPRKEAVLRLRATKAGCFASLTQHNVAFFKRVIAEPEVGFVIGAAYDIPAIHFLVRDPARGECKSSRQAPDCVVGGWAK